MLLVVAAGAVLALVILPATRSRAQMPGFFPTPTTPMAQKNALSAVQSQVSWLQNATRTASNYATGGSGMLWQQFQTVRGAFNALKATLTPQQLEYGANDLAELDEGLNIIQQAFDEYQNDVDNGRSESSALNSLSQVLSQAASVWLQELNKDASRLNVGW